MTQFFLRSTNRGGRFSIQGGRKTSESQKVVTFGYFYSERNFERKGVQAMP